VGRVSLAFYYWTVKLIGREIATSEGGGLHRCCKAGLGAKVVRVLSPVSCPNPGVSAAKICRATAFTAGRGISKAVPSEVMYAYGAVHFLETGHGLCGPACPKVAHQAWKERAGAFGSLMMRDRGGYDALPILRTWLRPEMLGRFRRPPITNLCRGSWREVDWIKRGRTGSHQFLDRRASLKAFL